MSDDGYQKVADSLAVQYIENAGFYVRDTSTGGGEAYVGKFEIRDFIAWLRKTYPEHFRHDGETRASPASVTVSIGVTGADALQAATRDARELADQLERAEAALNRLKGAK